VHPLRRDSSYYMALLSGRLYLFTLVLLIAIIVIVMKSVTGMSSSLYAGMAYAPFTVVYIV